MDVTDPLNLDALMFWDASDEHEPLPPMTGTDISNLLAMESK